jgi:DNA-binding GntR family transcriptional regulator
MRNAGPKRSAITPVAQQSTASLIAQKLRMAIGSGELPPGVQLVEAELASELGVSRGPLREGIQRLTQEGLLAEIRNRGVFVVEMTPSDVRDLYLARTAVEQAAMQEILDRDAGAAATELLAAVQTMARAARRKDVAAVSEADIAFHERLVALAASPRLTRMHQTLIIETRMCIHALEPTYALFDDRVSEHRAIAEALNRRDQARAVRLLRAHMSDAMVRLAPPSAGEQAGLQPDPDVLDLEELLDAGRAPLAAETGLLDAAERGSRVGHHTLVEPDHAGLQRLRDAQRAA